MKLPLAEKDFPSIQLTCKETHQIYALTDQIVEKTVKEYYSMEGNVSKNRWKQVRSKKGVSVYKDRNHPQRMMLTGAVRGTFQDIMDGIYSENTSEFRKTLALLSSKFLDGVVLNVIEKRSEKNPFIFSGVKWLAVKSPGGRMVHNRDLCFFDRIGTFSDQTGEKIIYRVLHSVDLPQCPAPKGTGLVRAAMSTSYLFRRLRKDLVAIYMVGDFDAAGHLGSRISDLAVANLWLSIRKIMECAQAKKFAYMMHTKKTTANSKSSRCDLCSSKSSFLDSQVNCKGCGKKICRKCRVSKVIFQPSSAQHFCPPKEIFCVDCVCRVALYSLSALKEDDSPAVDLSGDLGKEPPKKSDRNSNPRSSNGSASTRSSGASNRSSNPVIEEDPDEQPNMFNATKDLESLKFVESLPSEKPYFNFSVCQSDVSYHVDRICDSESSQRDSIMQTQSYSNLRSFTLNFPTDPNDLAQLNDEEISHVSFLSSMGNSFYCTTFMKSRQHSDLKSLFHEDEESEQEFVDHEDDEDDFSDLHDRQAVYSYIR